MPLTEGDAVEERRGEDDVVGRSPRGPSTVASLTRDLATLGLPAGSTVLVHSSLRRLGWVAGGETALLLALEQALGPKGTLVMPAFSGSLSEPSYWMHPAVPEAWWSVVRESMPAYDPALTAPRRMGALVDCFLRQPGTLRSAHPASSFAARGPEAVRIVRDHALAHSLGESSPLARLYDLHAWVLLLGVGHDRNSSLHLSEHRAAWPSREIVMQGAPISDAGVRRWVTFPDLDYESDDFEAVGAAFEASGPHVRAGPVGSGAARLMPQRALVDFGARWLAEHRT